MAFAPASALGSGPWRSSDVSTTAYSAPASARNGRPCQSKPSRSWAGTAAPTLSSITSNSIERLDGVRRWNRRTLAPARWRNRRRTASRSNSRRLVPPPAQRKPTSPASGTLRRRNPWRQARIDAKVLEEAKQRDPEEERVLACRAVRATPGQPAPPGQYDGRGGIETAVGIRVAPGFPAPKGGYEYGPDYLRHWNGYKGELELKNRIEKAVPYEKIVHYGNPAGEHGPDVMTIGPKGRIMEWNSRSRQNPRRIRAMASLL